MNNYLAVLQLIHKSPQTFQSNHFRGNSSYYAEAASRGHISCVVDNHNTGRWMVTSAGLAFIELLANHK